MIDTHAHIDDPQYADALEEYLSEQKANGVTHILVPATNRDSCYSVLEVCRQHQDFCFPALGIHPEEVKDDYLEQLDDIHQLIEQHHDSLCAIGEIGLDYHFDTTYKAEQQEALRRQLQWALDYDLPVMIHSRDATDDCLSILEEYAQKRLRGVMHCFSGSYETAQRILKINFYLGIGGVITFKNAKLKDTLGGSGREPIPLSRLVLETDCPYMAPVPYRGKRNESRFMKYVIDTLCSVYDLPQSTIDDVTTANACTLFSLKNEKN